MIEEIAGKVAECFNPAVAVEVWREKNPEKKAERYVPSVARVQRELGLMAGIDLHEAIGRTIRWNTVAETLLRNAG